MNSTITEQHGICVYSVLGDIDMYSAPDFHKKYLELAAKPAQTPLIIDLEKSSYIDSSGIGVLVQILADTKKRKIPFVLCNVNGMIEKLFLLTRMNLILPQEKTLLSALTRIRTER